MMTDVVEMAGGMISRHDYIQGVMEMQVNDGYDYDQKILGGEASDLDDAISKHYSSIKSNCFNTGRMLKAGVRKVIIGTDTKGIEDNWYVVSADLADQINAGGVVSLSGNFEYNAGSTGSRSTEYIQSPTTNVEVLEGDLFYGIPARNPADYPVELQAKICDQSTGYIEQKNELKLMCDAFKRGHNIITKGPTAAGKTLSFFELSHRLKIPLLRFNAKDGMTWMSLVGSSTVTESENGNSVVTFRDGILTKAMRYGCILYVDEITFGSASVLGGLHEVMDDQTLYIEDTGEFLVAHPDFRVVGSHNPNYSGTKPLNIATRRRFQAGITYDYLSPDIETTVIQAQSGISNPEAARQLVAWANICRDQKKEGSIETDVGTGSLVDCMAYTDEYSLKEAMEITVLDHFNEYELETVEMNARAIIGDF